MDRPPSYLTMLLSRHTTRRAVLSFVAFSALDWPFAAIAQQKRLPVVGWLGIGAPTDPAVVRDLSAFSQGLNETGFVEGRNVRLDYRWTEGHNDRLPALAASLVVNNVDVIIAAGSLPQALAAKGATRTIPIVFATGADPVKEGLVSSLARPGGNLTGVATQQIELSGKRIELLSELMPQAKTIGLLINPDYGAPKRQEQFITGWRKAASARGLQFRVVKASTESELGDAFAGLAQLGVDALVVTPYFMVTGRPKQIASLALRYKVPTISSARVFVAAGGLMNYGPSPRDLLRQVGNYAGRILKGAKPTDLPVQQPTKFELVINMKTAKALGLAVPQSLLARADEVIE